MKTWVLKRTKLPHEALRVDVQLSSDPWGGPTSINHRACPPSRYSISKYRMRQVNCIFILKRYWAACDEKIQDKMFYRLLFSLNISINFMCYLLFNSCFYCLYDISHANISMDSSLIIKLIHGKDNVMMQTWV